MTNGNNCCREIFHYHHPLPLIPSYSHLLQGRLYTAHQQNHLYHIGRISVKKNRLMRYLS